MKELGSKEFRVVFHRLIESTVVTALGRPIGLWLTVREAERLGLTLGESPTNRMEEATIRNPRALPPLQAVPKPGKRK